MALTSEQQQQFFREGYVVVRGVVSAEDLPRYRDAYERMVAKVKRDPCEEYGTRLMKGATWGCNALLHPTLYEREFTDHLVSPPLLAALTSLLGDDLRVAGLKAIWSDRDMEYDLFWHRDGPDAVYTPDGTQAHLQFNTALYPDRSFRFVPGSHRRPLTEEEKAQSQTGTGPLPGEQVPTLEPGDALFMHSHLFHRGKTDAGTLRRTLHTILARTDMAPKAEDMNKLRRWYDQQSLDRTLTPEAVRLFANLFRWEGTVAAATVNAAPAAY